MPGTRRHLRLHLLSRLLQRPQIVAIELHRQLALYAETASSMLSEMGCE